MRLLVVEDEPQLGRQLQTALQPAGFAVDLTDNGIDGEHLGATEPYDAIVLDIGLPGRDGLSVLARWRRAGMDRPVLLLTARASWQEKVQGIDAGADDNVAKPFQMEELISRLRALIRRSVGVASAVLRQGAVVLDTRVCRLEVAGSPVALTGHEYRTGCGLAHPGAGHAKFQRPGPLDIFRTPRPKPAAADET